MITKKRCESLVSSHSHSQAVPGVWSSSSEHLYSDGVGRASSGAEVIIMESPDSCSHKDMKHSMGDTSKLITMMTNSLRADILCHQGASLPKYLWQGYFDEHDTNKWQVVQLRSAMTPVTWDSKVDMLHAFELVATLQVIYSVVIVWYQFC